MVQTAVYDICHKMGYDSLDMADLELIVATMKHVESNKKS